MFGIANAGNVLLIVSIFVTVLGFGLSGYYFLLAAFMLALPVVILLILGSIFVNVSKREFAL